MEVPWQFIALAVAEKIAALTMEGYLQKRASRGDRMLSQGQAIDRAVATLSKQPGNRSQEQ